MLKSYEAIYENGQVRWLTEPPQVDAALEHGAKLASVDGLFSRYSELEGCLLNPRQA